MAIFREGYRKQKSPDPVADAERRQRTIDRWADRFRVVQAERPDAARECLRELAGEIGSHVDAAVRTDLGPLSAHRGFPYGVESSYGTVAALERLSFRDPETGEQADCAGLYFEARRGRLVLSLDLPSMSPSARQYAEAVGAAFRGMFGARAWPVWSGTSHESAPRIESVHFLLETPDPKEAGRLLPTLAEAIRSGNEKTIGAALDAVGRAIIARTPYKPDEFHGSYLPMGEPWIGVFGSGTSGERLFLRIEDRQLSYPSDSWGLSWTYQDGMKRLFGDRAVFSDPKSRTRSLSVKIP